MLAMMFAGRRPRGEQRRRAPISGRLGLALASLHKPQQLSRGEQQRVAIARAAGE